MQSVHLIARLRPKQHARLLPPEVEGPVRPLPRGVEVILLLHTHPRPTTGRRSMNHPTIGENILYRPDEIVYSFRAIFACSGNFQVFPLFGAK
jgi:hypothetical protein